MKAFVKNSVSMKTKKMCFIGKHVVLSVLHGKETEYGSPVRPQLAEVLHYIDLLDAT